MIISASRRTDIPAYFSQWFLNRLQDKFVLVRNPMNLHQVSKINLSPEVVDCIVFWSKNPEPMLNHLTKLSEYPFYFQFTLNGYGREVEEHLPDLSKRLDTFKRLADQIGRERVILRYDPILLSKDYTIDFHADQFGTILRELKDATCKCTFSFIDSYAKIQNSLRRLGIYELGPKEKNSIAGNLSEIAKEYRIALETCAEDIDLYSFGIHHGRCIDDRLIESLSGSFLDVKKDRNQRLECGCVASVDIGAYNTCLNGCQYCYANYSKESVCKNYNKYQLESPVLCSFIAEEDAVTERKAESLKRMQIDLFSYFNH